MAQQVFGKIQARLGKPARARHGRPVFDRSAAALAHDIKKLPHEAPERLRLLCRPLVKTVPVPDAGRLAGLEPVDKAGCIGLFAALCRRPPHGSAHAFILFMVRLTSLLGYSKNRHRSGNLWFNGPPTRLWHKLWCPKNHRHAIHEKTGSTASCAALVAPAQADDNPHVWLDTDF